MTIDQFNTVIDHMKGWAPSRFTVMLRGGGAIPAVAFAEPPTTDGIAIIVQRFTSGEQPTESLAAIDDIVAVHQG